MSKDSPACAPACESEPYPETTSIDTSIKDIKNFKLGQTITITIKGEVMELRQPARKGDKWDKPSIRVKVISKNVSEEGVYDELARDKDEDDED